MANDMYNLNELSEHFTLQLTPGNLKEGMKAIGATSNDLWKVPVEQLRPIEGFNVRVRNAKYLARVRKYADSLKKHGYLFQKPMSGYMARDASGNDVAYFTAGYTRREAIDLANSELPEDQQIKFVSMVMQPAKTTTMRQLNALLITENESAALDPYEQSIVCKRMLNDGATVAEIASETGFSTEWVDSLLELAAAPQELQLMVVDDIIKPTFAIETIKEHGGEGALAILKEALARKTGGKAQPPGSDQPAASAAPDAAPNPHEAAAAADANAEEGPAPKKVRLTAKDLTSPEVRKFQNSLKREAPVMYNTLSSVTEDPAFGTLATETREKLLALMDKLKKHEVPSGEPDPRQTPLFDADTAAPASTAGASGDTSAA